MHSCTGLVPFSRTSTGRGEVGCRDGREKFAQPRGAIRANDQCFRDRRRQREVEARKREVERARVGQPDWVELSAEHRHREPLVHRHDQVPQCLDERPFLVDRLMQRLLGEGPRQADGLRPLVFESRPRCAHVLGSRRTQHRPQRVPRITLVHVRRDVDTVDRQPCRPARRCRRSRATHD